MKSPIDKAADIVSSQASIARICGVTPQAFSKWKSTHRLPRTEFTGETNYAERIEAATNGAVAKSDLIAWSLKGWSKPSQENN